MQTLKKIMIRFKTDVIQLERLRILGRLNALDGTFTLPADATELMLRLLDGEEGDDPETGPDIPIS